MYEVKTLHVNAGVRYWEDATVNDIEDENGDLIPCQNGKRWMPIIDVESGLIINWTKGTKARVHYKVCDDGVYSLHDAYGVEIIKQNSYVLDSLSPKEEGEGDYIIMDIDENGLIDGWKFNVNDFKQIER